MCGEGGDTCLILTVLGQTKDFFFFFFCHLNCTTAFKTHFNLSNSVIVQYFFQNLLQLAGF